MAKRIDFKLGDVIGGHGASFLSDCVGVSPRECIFSCGYCRSEFRSNLANVKHSKTKSCGCIQSAASTRHGNSRHPLYNVWNNIKHRTGNKNYSLYSSYGAKGVGMHKPWRDSFEMFFNWCVSNGWSRGLEIDRVDTKGNYEPLNCRFITKSENAKNKVNSKIWIVNGVEYSSLSDAESKTGVGRCTIRNRSISDKFENYSFRSLYE